MKIAVIGAGMAGAACARALADLGYQPAVFDKGRGAGGRLAQRRRDGAMFDHGAQFFTCRDAEFCTAVHSWLDLGLVAHWPDLPGIAEGVFVGTPSMSAPVKHLLGDIELHCSVRAERLMRSDDTWTIVDSDGNSQGPFAAIVITTPQPQTLELLATTPFGSGLASGIGAVGMAPCWTAMLAFDKPLARSDRANGDPGHPVIGFVACNNSKPGRSGREAWTIQASAAWSHANLERPAADVLTDLIEAFGDWIGRVPIEPELAMAHRWRYARVEQPLGEACAGDPASSLWIAGDWCIAPRVEAAFVSGRAAASALAKSGISR